MWGVSPVLFKPSNHAICVCYCHPYQIRNQPTLCFQKGPHRRPPPTPPPRSLFAPAGSVPIGDPRTLETHGVDVGLPRPLAPYTNLMYQQPQSINPLGILNRLLGLMTRMWWFWCSLMFNPPQQATLTYKQHPTQKQSLAKITLSTSKHRVACMWGRGSLHFFRSKAHLMPLLRGSVHAAPQPSRSPPASPPLAPRPLFPTNPHSSASWHCCCSGRCVGARGRRPGPSLQPRPGNEIPTPQPAKGQPAAFSPSRGPFSGPPPSGEDITGFWSMIQPSTPAALSTAHTEELGGEAVVGGGVVEERCGHHREQRPRGGGGDTPHGARSPLTLRPGSVVP